MLPLLFLLTKDMAMRLITDLGNKRIVWDLTTRLEVLDFDDDIVHLAQRKEDIPSEYWIFK